MIEAVNRGLAQALMENGDLIPVTNWIDCDGEQCEADEAVACVAGPDANDGWWSIDLSSFEARPAN